MVNLFITIVGAPTILSLLKPFLMSVVLDEHVGVLRMKITISSKIEAII
jgi:hypothetical protein